MASNPRLIDLTGQRFGMWAVLSKAGNSPRGAALWLCQCDCGGSNTVAGTDLRNGKSISCGCRIRAQLAVAKRSHGASGSRLHRIWKGMRARCFRAAHPQYPRYGGRGISVCDQWESFDTFRVWSLASGYADDLTIERIDVDKGYNPDNCTWIPHGEQAVNRRFVRRAPDGELWWHKARANGITWAAFTWRVGDGWPMEEAVTWPLGQRRIERDRDENGRYI